MKQKVAAVALLGLGLPLGHASPVAAPATCAPVDLGLTFTNKTALAASLEIIHDGTCLQYRKVAQALVDTPQDIATIAKEANRHTHCTMLGLDIVKFALPTDDCQLQDTWCVTGLAKAAPTLPPTGVGALLGAYCDKDLKSVGDVGLELLDAATHCGAVELKVDPLGPFEQQLLEIGQPLMEKACAPYVKALRAVNDAAVADQPDLCPSMAQYNKCASALVDTLEELYPSDCVAKRLTSNTCEVLKQVVGGLWYDQGANGEASGEACASMLPLRGITEAVYVAHQNWCSTGEAVVEALDGSDLSQALADELSSVSPAPAPMVEGPAGSKDNVAGGNGTRDITGNTDSTASGGHGLVAGSFVGVVAAMLAALL